MTRLPARLVPLLLAALLLCAGCSLPLAEGVQTADDVPAEQQRRDPVGVIPPGPQPGAPPIAVVQGFLAAQSSSRDRHGVARSFLAPAAQAAWDDEAGVTVYDPEATATPVLRGTGTVTFRPSVLGRVAGDGSASVAATPQPESQTYRLEQDAGGQWRLTEVPPGLTLSEGDRDRSYFAASVMFLAQGPAAGEHLVPDAVLVSLEGDRAQRLVERLVAGPSVGLRGRSGGAGSAGTAVPPGTRLLGVDTTSPGEVAVDLSGEVGALDQAGRRALSAQLVWTLKLGLPEDFATLRLLVEGEPLEVDGDAAPQPRTAWPEYDPEGRRGAEDVGGALVVRSGQVLETGVVGVAQPLPAVAFGEPTGALDAVRDARTGSLAVLTEPAVEDGPRRALSLGAPTGPLAAVTVPGGGLPSSPTWGDGSYGAWFLVTGDASAVMVATIGGEARPVVVPGLPALNGRSVLRVSRDGARVALVTGGDLYVGLVVAAPGDRPPRVERLTRLAGDVRDVAWVDGTRLVALVTDTQEPFQPLLRLSVDGTSRVLSGLQNGAEQDARTVSAAGDRVLVGTITEAVPAGPDTAGVEASATLYSQVGDGFGLLLPDAARPRFPD